MEWVKKNVQQKKGRIGNESEKRDWVGWGRKEEKWKKKPELLLKLFVSFFTFAFLFSNKHI